MRTVLRVAAVLASVGALAASATAPSKPALVAIPELTRPQSVRTETAIEGVDVGARPLGIVGWEVQIANKTEATVFVLWDESSFVSASGNSAGRMITGNTRRIDTAKAQPPTPIAPRAVLTESFFPEKLYEAELEEQKAAELANGQGGATLMQAAAIERLREQASKAVLGGRLYVAVQGADTKQTWVGVVVGDAASRPVSKPPPRLNNERNDPSKASAYWCSPNQCFADEARCQGCAQATEVWCASGENGFLCAATRMQCLTLANAARDRSMGECVTQRPEAK